MRVEARGVAARPDTPGITRHTDEEATGCDADVTRSETVNPLVSRIAEAIAEGSGSWAAIGRRLGVSRTWARHIGTGAGLAPARPPAAPARSATLNVRVRDGALAQLDAYAAAETARRGRPVRRSEAARVLLAQALAASRR